MEEIKKQLMLFYFFGQAYVILFCFIGTVYPALGGALFSNNSLLSITEFYMNNLFRIEYI